MQQNQPLEHHTAKQSHLAIVYSQGTLLLTYILLLFLVFLMDMLAVFIPLGAGNYLMALSEG